MLNKKKKKCFFNVVLLVKMPINDNTGNTKELITQNKQNIEIN